MSNMGPKRGSPYDLSTVNQQKLIDERKSSKKTRPLPLQMTQEHFEAPISPSSNPFSWNGRLRNRRNIPQKQGIEKISFKNDCINTSDYGSASESSRKSSLVVSTDESCLDQMRGSSTFLESTLINEDCVHFVGCSVTPSWSDSGNEDQDQWNNCDSVKEKRIFQTLKEEDILIKVHSKDGVVVLIPTKSTSCNNYELTILTGAKYEPHLLLGTIRASNVILLEPGTKFSRFPALIFMPLFIEPGPTDTLECLYSNTSSETNPKWEKLSVEQFYYHRGIVVISTLHFSLFTVVIRSQPQETRRVIKQRGGRLRNPAAPGVEVNFPRGCLEEDIVASVQVLFEDDPYETRALASPIVMVGPHGYQFSVHQPPVTIRLPIPDYVQIRDRFPTKLSVWQSNTSENEAVFWEKLEVDVRVKQDSRGYHVVFPVYHFSFFKVMWDILSASLLEAKMGMSYFYPFISFSMMCQAFMDENADSSRFGLEVICHRSDRRLPELTNYKHRVGASLKPKLVKPGKILVRLKSQLFEADIDAGEDPEMLKEEYDFRGRDFEKQYACRFKGVTIDRGTFGKVTVERVGRGGLEPVFEFNLQKSGNENETTIPNCSDRWSVVAVKELAGSLRILEDQNWKTLARYIGFTRQEIKSKLQYSADPFLSIVSMYQARSGSPEEFVQALYAVSRELQICGQATDRSPRCENGACGSQGSSHKGSSPQGSQNSSQNSSQHSCSPLHATKKGLWASLSPWTNKDEDSDTSGTQSTQKSAPTRKRANPSSGNSAGSSKGKSLNRVEHRGTRSSKRPKHEYPNDFEPVSFSTTDKSEDDDSKEITTDKDSNERNQRRIVRANRKKTSPILVDSDSEDECSTQKCKRDPRMMTDGDLWRASSTMNNINWRALGRTLGLQESALVNIESSYRKDGCRECAYQVLLEWKGQKPKQCTVGSLYTALTKENMNEVAKKIAAHDFGPDD